MIENSLRKRIFFVSLFFMFFGVSLLSAQTNYYIIKAEISEISTKKKARRNTYVLEKDEINKLQIKSNGIYRGPIRSLENAVAAWIYEGFESYTSYAILEGDNILSVAPKEDFPDLYEEIRYAFVQDRNACISKYDVVPSAAVEAKYQNETNVLLKKLHPRDYYFDLFSAGIKINFSYNYEKDVFETSSENELNFTNFVSNDTPKKGDRIHFYYNLKTPFPVKNVVFTIHNLDKRIYDSAVAEEFIDDKDFYRGFVIFTLKDDFTNGLFLKIEYDNQGERPDFEHEKNAFRLSEIIDSTDTAKEAEILKNGVKNGQKIVEVSSIQPFDNTAEPEIPEVKENTEEELIDNTLITPEDLDAEKKLLEQRLRDIEEQQRQQEELEKALAAAQKRNVPRQGKEFLHDFEPENAYDAPKSQKPKKTYESFEEFIEDPNEEDAEGKTLLIKAARMGNDWQIKALIASGADVNKKDRNGWTALMYSVRYQENLTAIDLLLKAGADPSLLNNFGVSALTLATCYNNNPAILEMLLTYFEPSNKDVLKSLTMLFINNQDSEFIQMAKLNCFLKKAVPLNTFYEGKTPLMYACQFGNSTAAIKLLLDNNANVTVRSSEGKTAFDYASKNTRLQHDEVYWSLNRKR